MFPLLERNVPHIEEKILSYLEPRDLAASRLVCREWSCKAKPFLCEWYEVKQRNEGRVPLIEATRHGYVDLVAYLLKDEQLDVNECHYMWPALVCEAHGGHVEIIKLLLHREDINVNATDLFGQTPLIWAACKGHASIAECLLQHPDIDINREGYDFKGTALDHANKDCRNHAGRDINDGKRKIASMLEKRHAKSKVVTDTNILDLRTR